MKLIFVATIFVLFGVQAAAQSPEIAEAERLEESASISFSKGDFKQAGSLLKRSLALKEKSLGSEHPDVAATLHHLANVYQSEGKYGDAEPLYLRSISIREAKLGSSHADTVQVVKDYACSYQKRRSPPDYKSDQNKVRLLKRAGCLLAGLADDCQTDGILNGKAISLPFAAYPKGAKATQRIYVYVHVDEQGKIVGADAPCGDPLLRKAAIGAASQAKFRPKLVNGKPTEVYGVLIYDFVYQ